MQALLLYVSTNMSRDGDLWFFDEGLAASVAELRRRGHDARMRLVTWADDEDAVAAWVEKERGSGPALLCFLTSLQFSAYAHDNPDTFHRVGKLAERVRLPAMFCGLWATLNAESLLEHPGVHMVGRGEMDDTLADVCDAIQSGRSLRGIPNLWLRDEDGVHRAPMRPLVPDLDARPLPARDLLPVERHANERDGILTVLASRGCPMSCEFCTHVVLRKAYDVRPSSYMRYKSLDRIFAEIAAARREMPHIWAVFFHDDIFLLQPEWQREFFRRYPREVGLPFGCNLVIGQVDEERICGLAAAGCRHVQIGVESGSATMRAEVLGKALSDEAIRSAVATCRRYGVRAKFYALLGTPGEDRRELVRSLKGFASYDADMVQVQVWLAHETSDLLELDREAAATARRLYAEKSGDRRASWLRFYFHHYQRYVAIYQLLRTETRWPLRRRLIRAAVTASVRLPFAPDLLISCDWDGRPRWPRRFTWLRSVARVVGGAPLRWLDRELPPLENRLAADYLAPDDARVPAEGWIDGARIDRRRATPRAAAVSELTPTG